MPKSLVKKQIKVSTHSLSRTEKSKPLKPALKQKQAPSVRVTFDEPTAAASETVATNGSSKPKGKGKAKEIDSFKSPKDVAVKKERKAKPTPGPSSSFLIVVGSYEKNLYGLSGTLPASSSSSSTVPSNLKLSPVFIFPAHLSCIKAVAGAPGGGKWLATGSDDEIVKIWDLKRRKEVGGLSQHVGSITSLTFPTKSHLLSSSEDSTISLFRTSDWALLRSLKGHSGRVNHVDVHPSGKVALSVGKDKTLKMWDLMRGRGAASLGLGLEGEVVKFAPSGKFFAVLSPKSVEVYDLSMKHLSSITHPKRLHDLAFSSIADESGAPHELLLTGTEDGKVLCFEVVLPSNAESEEEDDDDEEDDAEKKSAGKVLLRGVFGGHSNRIKSISSITAAQPSSSPDQPDSLVALFSTASSDGKINVYSISSILPLREYSFSSIAAADEAQPIATYDTNGSRLVCATMMATPAGSTKRVVRDTSDGIVVDEGGEGHEEDEEDEEEYEEDDFYGEIEEEEA